MVERLRMLKSTERLERLVAMVPWLIANNGASVTELSTRFQYPKETLINDLTKILFFVGPHPHTPGDLIEVNLFDDEVWINQAQFLSKPLRLKTSEAFSLLIKGKMLMSLLEEDSSGSPLDTALAKLALSVNSDPSEIEVEVGIRGGDTYRIIRDGINAGTKVKINYYSFNSDENTERIIHPISFVGSDRYLYLEAYCEMASAYRTFRLDRIVGIEAINDPIDDASLTIKKERNVSESGDLEFPFTGSESVTLLIDRADDWIIPKYPTSEVVVEKDGRLSVTLPISSSTWLGRLLLRLNPNTEITQSPENISESVGALTAIEILKCYEL